MQREMARMKVVRKDMIRDQRACKYTTDHISNQKIISIQMIQDFQNQASS